VRRGAALLLLGLGACTSTGRSVAPAPDVAVSIFPLYDLTRRVAGDARQVELLLAPGGDAHVSSLGARQVARLAGARLIVGVGPGFDAWGLEAARRAGSDPAALWLGGPQALEDPHIWLDPVRMQAAVLEIGQALARVDPEGEAGYRQRAHQLAAELGDLDAEIRRRVARWPRRAVVTAHAFLGPFAERYGLRVAAVLEPVPGRELTPKSLSHILAAIREGGEVAAILVPVGDAETAARVAAEESGLPLVQLDLVGGAEGEHFESVLLGVVGAIERALG
jgi:ABC-type Zn uptake system ZnuABC Zn-binding protein ZnuA